MTPEDIELALTTACPVCDQQPQERCRVETVCHGFQTLIFTVHAERLAQALDIKSIENGDATDVPELEAFDRAVDKTGLV